MIENGSTVRAHLLSVYKQTGHKPDLLASELPLPIWAFTLWEVFVALAVTREYIGETARAIRPTEIQAHTQLMGVKLSQVEYRLLLDLDRIYLRHENGR